MAGFQRLFERAGLVDVSVTTPGKLDVDIVRNASRQHPELLSGQRFLQRLIQDDHLAAAFQGFLAENRLSSHAWVLGKVLNVSEPYVKMNHSSPHPVINIALKRRP